MEVKASTRDMERVVMSPRELKELFTAWVVLSLCFSIRAVFSPTLFLTMLTIAFVAVGLGFALHELAHKCVARFFGCWAEFRLWRWGLVIALLLSLVSMGRIIFAAPGAVLIMSHRYPTNRRETALIALAGPLTNIALATAFSFLTGVDGFLRFIAVQGHQVNLWLAIFNMIPFGPADGWKIFSWNKLAWAAITVPLCLVAFLPTI
jgi:Zn-dependent protease